MTLKEYLKRVKNGEELVIRVPTQADYDKLMQELDKTNVRWIDGDKPSACDCWESSDTCICVDGGMSMWYSGLMFYELEGYTIIPFSDLIFDESKPSKLLSKNELVKEHCEKLKEIDSYDTESAHAYADDALCDLLVALGYKEVVDEYNKIHKWYA